jgi:hypothetical protein
MPPSQPVEEVPSPVSQIEWPAASSGEKLSPPLARKGTVRENTNKVTPYTSQEDTGMTHLERTKKKATSDPVVQKVVEMFKAEIKDINLK